MKQLTLFDFRGSAFQVRAASIGESAGGDYTNNDHRRVIVEDPFGFLALMQLRVYDLEPEYLRSSWYSDFQHRLVNLVAVAIACHLSEGEADVESLLVCTVRLLEQLEVFVRERIAPTEPNFADCILSQVIPGALEDIGLEPSSDGTGDFTAWIEDVRSFLSECK